MSRYTDTHCHCGMYLPASVRKAGRDTCGNCEREQAREAARYALINAAIDAVDGAANETEMAAKQGSGR